MRKRVVYLAALATFWGALADCGKKGAPLPPIVLYPALVRDLVVRQEGSKYILYFTEPILNNDASKLIDLDRIDIFRIVEERPPVPQSQPAQTQPAETQPGQTQPAQTQPAPSPRPPVPINEVTVQDFETRAGKIATIEAKDLANYRLGTLLTFTDALSDLPALSGLNKRFTYAVQPFNHKDRGPGYSNRVTQDMLAVADPVRDVKASVQEIGVLLTWTPPVTNINGSTPPTIIGYNVYRRLASDKAYPADPVSPGPALASPYVDATAVQGTEYSYMLKVAASAGRPYQESARSGEIQVTPKDIFPPQPPKNLVAVASKSGVNLLWSANQERDLAGYRIYRRSGNEKYVLLTNDIVLKNTFQDTTVRLKTTYFYVVTAIDRATPVNESGNSNEAKEYVP